MNKVQELRDYLDRPVSAASLAVVRMGTGAILFWEVYRYWSKGWIRKIFIKPPYHFKYFGWEWMPTFGEQGNYALFAFMAVAAFFLSVGLFTRIATLICFIGVSYIAFFDQAYYLNHFYFTFLMMLIMVFMDTGRMWSFDNKIFGYKGNQIPFWQPALIMFIMGVVYFYGGIAKINLDWIQGIPLHQWLKKYTNTPIVGPLYQYKATAIIMAWTGLLLDLLVVPALIFKRTRVWAFVSLIIFHLTNSITFKIGIFPWLSLVVSTIYFEPHWPIHALKRFLPDFNLPIINEEGQRKLSTLGLVLIGLYVIYNVLMPFRHWLYPGNVGWTDEAHKFSWRMKLRNKKGKEPKFYVKDLDTGKEEVFKYKKLLTKRQKRIMSEEPDMLVQFAHFIKKKMAKKGKTNIEVRVEARGSYNFRPYRHMIDPNRNLLQDSLRLGPAPYILRDYPL